MPQPPRSRRRSWIAPAAALVALLLRLSAGPGGWEQAPDAGRVVGGWIQLQADMHAALDVPAADLARLAVGPPSAGFETLEDWSRSHPVGGQPAAISILSREGRPLAWAGEVRSLAVAAPSSGAGGVTLVTTGAVRLLFEERRTGEGLLGSIRIEYPFSTGERLSADLCRLFRLRSARIVEPGGEGSVRLETAAGLAIAAVHPEPQDTGPAPLRARAAALLGLGLLAWLLVFPARGIAPLIACVAARAAAPAHALSGWLPDPLVSGALFSAPAPRELLASPCDLLLTALTVTLIGAGLHGDIDAGDAPLHRRAAPWVFAALTLIPGGLAVAAIPSHSRLSPLRFELLSPEAARWAVQTAAVLLVFATLTPILGLCRRNAARVVLLCAAAAIAGGILAASESSLRAALIEEHVVPEILAADTVREQALRGLLTSAGAHPTSRLTDPDGAFQIWSTSPLARSGLRSAVAVLTPEGRVESVFMAGLPGGIASAFADRPPAATLLRESYRLLTLRIPLLTGETQWEDAAGGGRIAAMVSLEPDNLPSLSGSDPLLRRFAVRDTAPAFGEILGGEPVLVLFSPAGEVIYSSTTRPPALKSALQSKLATQMRVWKRVAVGGRDHSLLFFNTGQNTAAAGFPAASAAGTGSALVRFVVLALLGALALLAARRILAAPGGALHSGASLVDGLRSSFRRRLLAVLLVASILPLLAFSAILGSILKSRAEGAIEGAGVAALDSARRLLSDFLEASGASEGGTARAGADPRLSRPLDAEPVPIGDDPLFWLSRAVGQDLAVFVDGRLVAASRPDLYQAGVLSPVLDAPAARELLYGRAPYLIAGKGNGDDARTFIYAPVPLPGYSEPGVVALPITQARLSLLQETAAVEEGLLAVTALLAVLILGAAAAASRRISGPIAGITAGAARIAHGDYGVRLPPGPADETGRMTEAFNEMARALEAQRSDLRRRGDYIEKILLNATTGVISTDPGGTIRTINPAACLLLDLPPDASGRSLARLLEAGPERRAIARFAGAPDTGPGRTEEIFELPGRDGPRRLRIVAIPLPESDPGRPGRLLLVEDLTEIARSSRLAAWAEMARQIAHEIKNPLTPIQLSAEHLLRLRRDRDPEFDRVVESCLATILEQTRSLRSISGEFSDYARLPALRPVETDLETLVREILRGYRVAPPSGVTFEEHYEPAPPRPLDARVFRRAVVNLIENAMQSGRDGRPVHITVRLARETGATRITVADSGAGIDRARLGRIFDPYFSTRETGTGLGLPIARRAVEEHGGTLTAVSTPGIGTTMTIHLPDGAAPHGPA